MYRRNKTIKITIMIGILVLFAAGISGFLLYHHISMSKTAVTASISGSEIPRSKLRGISPSRQSPIYSSQPLVGCKHGTWLVARGNNADAAGRTK